MLVLFDIDGTLLRKQGPHHRRALEVAAKQVTGVPVSIEGIPVAGMLDHTILQAMLEREGVSGRRIRAAMDGMRVAAERYYLRNAPPLHRRVTPGARMLLYRLYRKGIPTGLVTGNFSRIGWHKMRRAGLERYLRFGAFAEMAKDRAGLVELAVREARRQGWIGRGSPVALIGDHTNDIRAAQANGVRSIAVATGVIPIEELRTYGPDLALPDLRGATLAGLFGG